MKVFPFALARISGDSFDLFCNEYARDLEKTLNDIHAVQQRINQNKNDVSELLLTFMQAIIDQKQQNLIQNVRRDIYNNRNPKPEALKTVLRALPDSTRISITAYLTLRDDYEALRVQLTSLYETAHTKIRERIIELAGRKSLQNGLIFSSRSLLSILPQYAETLNSPIKSHQTDRGLLKYLSRIYTKTSPFSSFTNLSIATSIDHVSAEKIIAREATNQEVVNSHLRVNNLIFSLLKEKLCKDRDFYPHFDIKLNPTIKKEQQKFKFLASKNNQETFQYLECNQFLDYIYSMFRKLKSVKSFAEIISTLGDLIDSTPDELEIYILQLLEHGFLETHLNISGLDPHWGSKLVKLLEGSRFNKVKAKPFIDLINELDLVIQSYSNLHTIDRVNCLNRVYDKIDAFFSPLPSMPPSEPEIPSLDNAESSKAENSIEHKPLNLKKEIVFYEDTTRTINISIDQTALNAIVTKLNVLLNSVLFLDGFVYELERMKIYFKSKYKNKERVPILEFYEDYYKDFKLAADKVFNSDGKIESLDNGDGLSKAEYLKYLSLINSDQNRTARVKAVNEWRQKLERELARYDQSTQVDITQDLIGSTLQGLNLSIPRKFENSICHSAFIQFLQEDGVLKGVINSSGPGYGRMLGRFLHLFENDVTELLRTWNEKHDGEVIYAEGVDGSFFNANIHPPLLHSEIWMPGSNNSLPNDRQIPISDLEINYDQSHDDIILRDRKTDKQIFVLDLGFQGERGRSKLYQMLTKFTVAPTFGTQNIVEAIHTIWRNKSIKNEYGVIVLPRIVFEDQVIIARKKWEIPRANLPFKKKTEEDLEYFKKINEWRKALDIPAQVFITINPTRKTKNTNENKLTSDDYKPQFINFLWPQFVKLLGIMLDKQPDVVWCEEMLPDSNQLLRINDKRHVSEYVINWYN